MIFLPCEWHMCLKLCHHNADCFKYWMQRCWQRSLWCMSSLQWSWYLTWGNVCADNQPPVKDQSGGITKAFRIAPLKYMDAKVPFALAVPEDSDRDLLLQNYGAADIMATFKGAMELEMDPVPAFKRAMKAKLAKFVSPMATWLSTPSPYNPITSN